MAADEMEVSGAGTVITAETDASEEEDDYALKLDNENLLTLNDGLALLHQVFRAGIKHPAGELHPLRDGLFIQRDGHLCALWQPLTLYDTGKSSGAWKQASSSLVRTAISSPASTFPTGKCSAPISRP